MRWSGVFTGNKRSKVPWAAMLKEPDRFFEDGEIPSSVALREPSKLRGAEVWALWEAWEGRQKEGKVGLSFRDALEKDKRPHGFMEGKGKGKNKLEYKELSSEEEDDEKSEGQGRKGDEGKVEIAGEEGDEGGYGQGGTEGDRPGDEEGETYTEPHICSPAAHASNQTSKLAYMKNLTLEPEFQKAFKAMKKVFRLSFISFLYSYHLSRTSGILLGCLIGHHGHMGASTCPPPFTRGKALPET